MELFGSSFTSTPAGTTTSSARISNREALLTPEGVCEADVSLDPAALRTRPTEIAPGIGECDLVRLKAKRPTDVLIGQGGTGQREAQVLYAEPGGREIYMFTDGKLARIIKPGQG
ncbi:MAG: hypothetical protein ACRCWO_00235 [Bosea sp. (in: a-proteobacteria)]